MSSNRPVLFLGLALFAQAVLALPLTSKAQQTPATAQNAPQALTLLQNSLAALTSGKPIADITLSDTVRRIAGSDDETGNATLKALVGTGSRLDLALASGSLTEVRNVSGGNLAGSWSGPDGVSHSIAYHNLLADSGVFPAYTIASFVNSASAVVTYIGTENKNGVSATHLSAYLQPSGITGDAAKLSRHLSQVDIFLDASTSLPIAFNFNTHAENNALVDIPTEIRFSGYRSANGAQIPFHVQKFLNNSLFLDLQFNDVQLNSGLSASTFVVQ